MSTVILKVGDERIFTKSGNRVRLVSHSRDGWIVERTTGTSAGKQMLCPPQALSDVSALWHNKGS